MDGHEISECVFVSTYKRRNAAARYPKIKAKIMAGPEKTEICQHYDKKYITTIVNDSVIAERVSNDWGFVAVCLIPNETFGEGPWGDDDISLVIPVQAEYKYREGLKTLILEQSIMQPLVIEGGDNVPAEIPMGPRDAINVLLGGKVYRVSPVRVPPEYLKSQDDLLGLIDRMGGVPEVMRSEFSGSTLTGRGIAGLMGPTQMEFGVKGNEMYPAIARLTEMAMQMWHAMWENVDHTVYFLDKNNSKQVERFRTGEFDGFYKCLVSVDVGSYYDAQSRFMMVLQGVQNRLVSRKTAMRYVPFVGDAVAEMAQIDAEMQADMQMAQANVARDESNPQPDMAAQGALNSQLEKGYIGKTPAPETVGGFEPPEGQEQGQSENLLSAIMEFFQTIPLKGKVWLAGGIVTNPSYGPSSPDWRGIEVFLEDANDKSAINTTMRNEFPQLHGKIRYHTGEPNPSEPSVLVYEPESEVTPESPEGPEMPNEFASFMENAGASA